MARPRTLITQAELAAVLGLSKGRISQMVRLEGFPSRPDGKIDRKKAVEWYRSVGLADRVKRGPKPKSRPAQPAAAPRRPAVDRAQAIEELRATWLDGIRERAAAILPELARRLGLAAHLVIGAADAFDSVLAHCGADPLWYDSDGDAYAWPPFATPGLGKPSARVVAKADAFLDRLEEMLDKLAPVPQAPDTDSLEVRR